MSARLAGKVAIVHGDGSGIGDAIAIALKAEGATVVRFSFSEAMRDRASAHADGFESANFAADEQARAAIDRVVAEHGRIDLMIWTDALERRHLASDGEACLGTEFAVQASIRSALALTRQALPHLKSTRGRLIGAVSEPELVRWAPAFVRAVALEQSKYGVSAHALCAERAHGDELPGRVLDAVAAGAIWATTEEANEQPGSVHVLSDRLADDQSANDRVSGWFSTSRAA